MDRGKAVRKIFVLSILVFIFVYCGRQREEINKTVENGIEIIRNKREPSVTKAIPEIIRVEKEMLLDFKSEEIAKLGIADIRGFDVDSEGNIYISVFSGDYCVYRFSPKGNFELSFARKGQGPGEMPIAKCLTVNENDEIVVFDVAKKKLILFSRRGDVLKEISLPPRVTRVCPLPNGTFLISTQSIERRSPFYYWVDLSLYDIDMKEIKRLDHLKILNGPSASYWFPWKQSVYVGSEERGYDIWVYDLNGKLFRKIKKKYRQIEVPPEIRVPWKRAIEQLKQSSGSTEDVKVPENWPPFLAFFIDEEGRLFVRTFEEGPGHGEYVHDIFDRRGVLIKKIILDLSFSRECEYAKLRNGKIYGLSEKGEGYEQLAAYRMKWESSSRK